jgi:hypothetical protein
MAIEHAFTKNGRIVKLLCCFLICYLSFRRLEASISSMKVKKGIVNDSVIVFVIAFFMPVSLLTLKEKSLK